MTNPMHAAAARTDRVLDRATRVACVLAWLAAFALFCALLWLLFASGSRAEDPKAAARSIGQAGTAAAGAIARDGSSAAAVPGYAGTDLAERNIGANDIEDAARARLADPDDPGGDAGRAVIEGVTARPPASVPTDDPVAVRAEAVADTPQAAAHGASGIASGGVVDCGAGVADAESGGACGAVTYCVGAGCETVAPEASTGFVDAAARLNMVLEMGGDEFDRDNLRFFSGERKACRIRWGGLANCCRNSGLLVGLANCSAAEIELGKQRHAGNTHYLGTLGRILHQQARPQLGIGWGSCRGFSVAEIERIEFDRLDLSEFTENLVDGSMEPSVSLPDKGGTQTFMRDRVRDFYSRGR
ncbi:MAG: conjugal transfer protein TraN [Rhodospirillales bacterium]|nr:conjugal transfer protein TraN [Rhodospirillales bacterium]